MSHFKYLVKPFKKSSYARHIVSLSFLKIDNDIKVWKKMALSQRNIKIESVYYSPDIGHYMLERTSIRFSMHPE